MLDDTAVSADPALPAFLAPPEGMPVYHGFPILEDVEVDGFRLGMIAGFDENGGLEGDGFVVAPDNSRCGLVWEVSEEPVFYQISAHGPDRWGVWAVDFPFPMVNRENARRNLEAVLPELKKRWEAWVRSGRASCG
jgi:hypothetical protein